MTADVKHQRLFCDDLLQVFKVSYLFPDREPLPCLQDQLVKFIKLPLSGEGLVKPLYFIPNVLSVLVHNANLCQERISIQVRKVKSRLLDYLRYRLLQLWQFFRELRDTPDLKLVHFQVFTTVVTICYKCLMM